MATFSDILARERKKKGLSKAELARRLNIPYTTYQNYENGREPKIDVIKQISDELSICPSVFFDLENNDFLFDHSYHPVQHDELNDILLYDSGKFFDMKENFDKEHEKIEDYEIDIYTNFDEFYTLLKNFRKLSFVSVDKFQFEQLRNDAYLLINRSLQDAQYQYQKVVYESQFMNEETINQYKANNPNYKKDIIYKVLFTNKELDLDLEDDQSIDTMYRVALKKYYSK